MRFRGWTHLPDRAPEGGGWALAPSMRPVGSPIRIATAVLVRDGRVLMAHRHPRREAYPDCWGLGGGHVESCESPGQAVSRECLEELGVCIHNPRPIPMMVSDPHLVMHAFLITHWAGEPVNAAPEEHDDLRWFRPSEIAGLRMAHPEALSNILSAVHLATEYRR
jgi:8-oxo-dGTP pyrophosphatase MutT (NUDIX family)